MGGDFHSLVADPTQPDTLYVGGHRAVSRSADAGTSWERVNSLNDADAMGWGFTDDAVLVSGHPGLTIAGDGLASFARSKALYSREWPRVQRERVHKMLTRA
ncbi:hypothetical protein BH24ACT5_BH24ACT5_15420 [soil metagenome]